MSMHTGAFLHSHIHSFHRRTPAAGNQGSPLRLSGFAHSGHLIEICGNHIKGTICGLLRLAPFLPDDVVKVF